MNNNKGYLTVGLVLVFAFAVVAGWVFNSGILSLGLGQAPAYEGTPVYNYVVSPMPCPIISKWLGSCTNPAPILCEYAAPPSGCQYIPGPNYDPSTQCGLVLNCSEDIRPSAD